MMTDVRTYFSPGPDCRDALVNSIDGAQYDLRVCVFTITDNRLAESLLKAHERGIRVRIITDNDKSYDRGSDILRLKGLGLPLRFDPTSNHMHHKFAVMDETTVFTGSYNWTRSAFTRNFENLVAIQQPHAVRSFVTVFDRLWSLFPSEI